MSNEERLSSGEQLAMHPAWQCAHRKLTNAQRWAEREAGLPAAATRRGYFDSEIALAMIIGGFGGDVVVTERDADGQPAAYAFPDVWYVVNEEASGRVAPAMRLMRTARTDESTSETIARFFPVSPRRYAALNGRG